MPDQPYQPKERVRAWLYELLARLETAESVDARKTVDHNHVTLLIEFRD